jgi:hypothetical protein
MRAESSKKPGRNDPCTCGANRKYKKCCERVENERQGGPQQYAHLSVKQIILKEIDSFKEIFRVTLKDDQLEVRERVTDSDVLLFVERVNNLWDSKPDLISSMPTKADLKFRALYFGDADILSTVNLLARYSLYCDQILIIDPLAVFHGMNRAYEHSPYVEPQAWVRQIIRDGVYLASLEGWIRNDLVFATAFPLSLYHPKRKKNRQEMKERLAAKSEEDWDELVQDTIEAQYYLRFTPAELLTMEPEESEMKLAQRVAEDDVFWNEIEPHMKGITRGKAIETFQYMKQRKEDIRKTIVRLQQEPRRYEWALNRQFEPRMNVWGSGMNLRDAEWLADLTGSHLVTDRQVVWNEILADEPEPEQKKHLEEIRRRMSALAEAFQRLQFYFLNDIPLDFALKIRTENRLVSFRTYLKEFWNKVRQEDLSEDQRLATIQEFQDGLEAQYQQFKNEFEEIKKIVLGKVALAGVSGAGAFVTGQITLGMFSLGVLASALPDEAKRQTKRSQALSVFLDLERR